MSQIGNITQDDLLEEQHNKFINQVTQSGMPLWYYELYNDSMYSYEEEVNRNRETPIPNSNHDGSNTLPF